MIKLIARLWLRYKKWRNRPGFPVYAHEGGYAAWKDKHPPRQDSWARIFALIITVAVILGVPCLGLAAISAYQVSQRPSIVYITLEPEITAEATAEITTEAEATAEITIEATDEVQLATFTATLTPMPIRALGEFPTLSASISHTPTLTPFPLVTINPLQRTLQSLQLTETARALTPTQPRPTATRTPLPVVTRIVIVTVIVVGGSGDPGSAYFPAPTNDLPIVPMPTALPTRTLEMWTDEPTYEPTPESTDELTPTETATATETETPTGTPTETETPTPTETSTPTWTPTSTATATPTPTMTPTPTSTMGG